jgi:hypothetical protein
MLTKCQSCNSGVLPGQLFPTHASAGDFRAHIAAGCCVEAVGYMLIEVASVVDRERLAGVCKSAVRSKRRLRCRKSRSGGRNQNQNTAELEVPSSFRIPLFRYSVLIMQQLMSEALLCTKISRMIFPVAIGKMVICLVRESSRPVPS